MSFVIDVMISMSFNVNNVLIRMNY